MENEGDLVTLNEALALIDSLDVTEISDSSSSSTNVNDNDTTSTLADKIPKSQVTKRKRRRCNLSSSTRLQQSKKAELLYLRKYVQELEEKRVKLETWDKGFCQAEMDAAEGSVWMDLAKTHFQARLRSETANRTLKTMLTNQTQVINLLQNIVHKQAFVLKMDQAGVVEASVSLSTDIDSINTCLKGVGVACAQYLYTDLPLV